MMTPCCIAVPTGHILVVEGEHGLLECLSLGDYGADVNLNQHKTVTHRELLPLTEKWVVTVSTQYGCSSGCRFCDVPKVGPGRNATTSDLMWQVSRALEVHRDVNLLDCKRINLHYARMGEPTFNPSVLEATHLLRRVIPNLHPVVSTMMPARNLKLDAFLREWMMIKNDVFKGNAGLQLSINSTSNTCRDWAFRGNALSLKSISLMMGDILRDCPPVGRKITLNFAVVDGWPIDAPVLRSLFSPEHFIVKLTPMHETTEATTMHIKTHGDATTPEPYQRVESDLRAEGFDVLVFIASHEEDASRITCGNAILSGSVPLTGTPVFRKG